MLARHAALWLLRLVALLGIGSFWVQATWDMQHPPTYQSPSGPQRP